MKFVATLVLLALAVAVWGRPQGMPQGPPSPDDIPEMPMPLVRVARQMPGGGGGDQGGMASNVPGFNEAKGVADMGVDMIPDAPGFNEAKAMYNTGTGMMG